MAWRQFISVIPTVIDFMKDLNLTPKTKLFATGGIIFAIAYSYKYFNMQNNNSQDLENVNSVSHSTENNSVLDDLQENTINQIQENQVEDISDNTSEDNNKNESVIEQRNSVEQVGNINTNPPTPQYDLQQNAQKAEQVFGAINNMGDNQQIETGNTVIKVKQRGTTAVSAVGCTHTNIKNCTVSYY